MVVALAMCLSLSATPASATRALTGLVQGFVQVGEWSEPECTKSNVDVTVRGRGLWFPGIRPADRSDDSIYVARFALTAGGDEQAHALVEGSGGPDRFLGSGELRLCGTMTSPAVAQANCFDSSGRDGFGEMDVNNNWPAAGFQREVQLSDVEWAGTIGHTVPITGRYETVDADGGKTGKLGTFLALLQVQGGIACMEGWNGAVWLVAAGVVAFLPA